MSPPPTSTLTGKWSGDLSINGTPTRMTWTLTEDATRVNGEVLVLLPNGTVLLNGVLSGTLTGTTLSYTTDRCPRWNSHAALLRRPIRRHRYGWGAPASALDGNLNLISSVCAPPVTGGTFTLTRE